MNKSAREMFEELGYYLDIETNDEQIVYAKNRLSDDTFGFIGAKTITYDKTLTKNVTTSELQAINQQCRELRWLDE